MIRNTAINNPLMRDGVIHGERVEQKVGAQYKINAGVIGRE